MNAHDVANLVWQAHGDADLLAMTPPRFYELLGGHVPDDELAEAGWLEFRNRQLLLADERKA